MQQKNLFYFYTMAQQHPAGQGLLLIEASLTLSDTPHSVVLLWTSDQPDADTSTCQNKEITKLNHRPGNQVFDALASRPGPG
jgi:hypothetical protein